MYLYASTYIPPRRFTRISSMIYNKEITHASHPQHKLKFEYKEVPFKCDGCKETGIGGRYKCDREYCDFDLHKHCALPTQSVSHPFYPGCNFQFLTKAPGSGMRYCNACGKDVMGFVYHCKLCGFDLHPSCYNLPHVLDDGEVKLYLYKKVSSPCCRCGRKGLSWSYRSGCKKYHLHVSCAKEMLAENWQELHHAGGGQKSGKELYTRIPTLKGAAAQNHNKNSKAGKAKVAGLALQSVASAILGEPTALIAGVIGNLLTK